MPQEAKASTRWTGVERRAWLVLLFATVAIPVLWAGSGIPTAQVLHADAVLEISGARTVARRRDAQLNFDIARIVQLTAEKVRLEAEREGAAEVSFPLGFTASDPRAAAAAARERRFFETRRAMLDRQKARLGLRIAQFRHEVDGLLMQQRAREKEVQLIRQELRLIDDMHGRQLVNVARLMSLRRELARAEGEVGGLMAQVARSRAQIEEIELQIVEIEQKVVLDAQKEIRDIEARIDELSVLHPREAPMPPRHSEHR